jgi:hypothetical protein
MQTRLAVQSDHEKSVKCRFYMNSTIDVHTVEIAVVKLVLLQWEGTLIVVLSGMTINCRSPRLVVLLQVIGNRGVGTYSSSYAENQAAKNGESC